MNRRKFLKSLFAIGALTAIDTEAAIDQFLVETKEFSDKDFITYVTWTMNLYVHNPAQCAMITNIEEVS